MVMKGTVLVVALEEDFRSGIKAHLHKRGYRVLGAADQAEAVGLLDRSGVDVVVWHCLPGDGCGWILMDHVRTLSPAPPVILLVSKGQVQHGIEGMKRGAFDDLLIPFAWENLEEKVEAAMEAGRKAGKKGRSLRPWEEDLTGAGVPAGTGEFQTMEEQEKGQDQRGKR